MEIPAEIWAGGSGLALLLGSVATRAMSHKLVKAWRDRAESLEEQVADVLAKLAAREKACETCPHRRAYSDSLDVVGVDRDVETSSSD